VTDDPTPGLAAGRMTSPGRLAVWWQVIEANLRAANARAYVRIVGANRELSWLVWDVFLPFMGTAAYVFIYRTIKAPPAFTGFVILGGAMTGYWLNTLWSMASQFYWERHTGNLEMFFVAPVSVMSILLGMAVGGMFQTTIRSALTVVLGVFVFHVRFVVYSAAGLLLSFLVTMVALYGLGMMMSSLYLLYGREAWHMSNLLQEPIYLLSGFYFPVRALGPWLAALAGAVPLTFGLDAMRQFLFGPAAMGWLGPWWEVAVLCGESAVFLWGARRALDYMARLARQEGRLTLRWQ